MITYEGTFCTSKVIVKPLYAIQDCICFFSIVHQLLFCAAKVPEKYATGLISLSLLISWHKTPEYVLFEPSVYNT